MPFKYYKVIRSDNKSKLVEKITFDISRYRKYTHTIEFSEPVTKSYAVKQVEAWLSVPVSQEYFDLVGDDCDWNWDEIKEDTVRGDLLGAATALSYFEPVEKATRRFAPIRIKGEPITKEEPVVGHYEIRCDS